MLIYFVAFFVNRSNMIWHDIQNHQTNKGHAFTIDVNNVRAPSARTEQKTTRNTKINTSIGQTKSRRGKIRKICRESSEGRAIAGRCKANAGTQCNNADAHLQQYERANITAAAAAVQTTDNPPCLM